MTGKVFVCFFAEEAVGEEGRVADDKLVGIIACMLPDVAVYHPDSVMPWGSCRVFPGLVGCVVIIFYGINHHIVVTLCQHKRQEACTSANIQYLRHMWQDGRPCALYAGVRSDFHCTFVLLYPELAEPEPCIAHAQVALALGVAERSVKVPCRYL